jgi:hypothetical protein
VAAICLVAVLVLTLRLLANLGVLSLSGADEMAVTAPPGAPEEENP